MYLQDYIYSAKIEREVDFGFHHNVSFLITSWEIDGETVETVSDFIFFWPPKSLQMVIASMKLKDAYSLEGKL